MAPYRFAAATAISLVLLGGAWGAEMPAKFIPAPAKPTAPVAAVAPKLTAVVPKLTAAQRCVSLETQFDDALPLHAGARKLASAKKLADEGQDDCAKKKYSLGARRLVAALADLGVTASL